MENANILIAVLGSRLHKKQFSDNQGVAKFVRKCREQGSKYEFSTTIYH